MTFHAHENISFNNWADLLEHGTNGLYQFLLDCGWTVHNPYVTTSGSTDKVFTSDGESGKDTLFIRITQYDATRVYFRMATYYKYSASAGTNPVDSSNEVGKYDYSGFDYNYAYSNSSLNAWFYGDKDYVFVLITQGANCGVFGFGRPVLLAPGQWSGQTRMNEAAGKTIAGAGNTTFTVDDTTDIIAGQKIFVINIGATSKGTLVRCTVQSVDTQNKTLTVSNDKGTDTAFDDNALVGFDPQPMMLCGPSVYQSASLLQGNPHWGGSFLYDPTTLQMTGTQQNDAAHNVGGGQLNTNTLIYYNGGSWSTAISGLSDPEARGEIVINNLVFGGHFDHAWATITGADQIRGYFPRLGVPSVAYVTGDTITCGSAVWRYAKHSYNNTSFALKTTA